MTTDHNTTKLNAELARAQFCAQAYHKKDKAITGLFDAVDAFTKEIDDNNVVIDHLLFERKKSTRELIDKVLPDFSSTTLTALKEFFPAFVEDYSVEDIFKANAKFLGLFSGSGAKQNLFLLKTQLSSYIDSKAIKYEFMVTIDSKVADIKERNSKLNKTKTEILDLIDLLVTWNDAGLRLPEAAAKLLGTLIPASDKARADNYAKKAQRDAFYSTRNPVVNQSYSQYVVDTSDTDVWLYLFTDVPTSLRTLLIDNLVDSLAELRASQQQSEPDNSENSDTQKNVCGDADSDNRSLDNSNDTGLGIAESVTMGIGAATGAGLLFEALPIATDDSLGYFS